MIAYASDFTLLGTSALPHGLPGERRIAEGDLLLVDYGTTHASYAADITRTNMLSGAPGAVSMAATACGAVTFAVFASVVIMLLLKLMHDYLRPRREKLVQKYIEVAGRITALYVGTVSVEMIMQGVRSWSERF